MSEEINRCVQCHRPVEDCDDTCVAHHIRRRPPLSAAERKQIARRLVNRVYPALVATTAQACIVDCYQTREKTIQHLCY